MSKVVPVIPGIPTPCWECSTPMPPGHIGAYCDACCAASKAILDEAPCECGCGSAHTRDCPVLADMRAEMKAGTMCPICGDVNACACNRLPVASRIIEQTRAYGRYCMNCKQLTSACQCVDPASEVIQKIAAAYVQPNQRHCAPGRHSFRSGGQHCFHCGISREQLKASFPIK